MVKRWLNIEASGNINPRERVVLGLLQPETVLGGNYIFRNFNSIVNFL